VVVFFTVVLCFFTVRTAKLQLESLVVCCCLIRAFSILFTAIFFCEIRFFYPPSPNPLGLNGDGSLSFFHLTLAGFSRLNFFYVFHWPVSVFNFAPTLSTPKQIHLPIFMPSDHPPLPWRANPPTNLFRPLLPVQ